MKVCRGCNKNLDISEFYIQKKRKDGSILYKNYCKKCHNESNYKKYHSLTSEEKKKRNKRYKENVGAEYHRNWKLQKQYGITLEDFNNMIEKQDNKCYICDTVFAEPSSRTFQNTPNVDHNHETGKIRKILCRDCNTMLGLAKENIQTLHNAIEYLGEHC